MTYPHIKASEIKIGSFYLAANPDWPYVREVTSIVEDVVTYNDYTYHTGELGVVDQGCTKSRFAAWAGRKLTEEEAARMKSAEGHALADQQAAALLMTSSYGLKTVASMLAYAVRNEVEGFHASGTEQTIKNTDKYMPEFNRLVRNAIYTGLYAILHSGDDTRAMHYAAFISKVPEYWEEPELTLPEPEKF